MVLDTTSLRITFALMALALVLLFYFCTFRPTRTPYSGWWCVALALYLAGSGCFLFNHTPHQVWANPLGNALLVTGGMAVWTGARSLRAGPPSRTLALGVPLLTLLASLMDTPSTNTWSGGPVFLAGMTVTFGCTSYELWRLNKDYSLHRIPLAVTSAALAVFYTLRLLVFLVDGQNGPTFVTAFGPGVTTMVTMVLLVVVSFSMSALSNDQQLRSLRRTASLDHLTGLPNRKALVDAVTRRATDAHATGVVIMADLDHFKSVNDTYGHAAGDDILRKFAWACTTATTPTDTVCRYGGEEFLLLLPGASTKRAEMTIERINHYLAAGNDGDMKMPTVSYGIAFYSGQPDLSHLIAQADAALYKAKSQGRNQAVHSANPE